MKKSILIIGLGWQGQKFIKYFLLKKNEYNIIGCCKTEKTKNKIEKEYKIKVFLDYRKVVKNNYDLIVSTVFPTNIQYEIVKYILENTNNKVLIDLPITFDIKKLKYLLSFKNLYLFNIEHYTKIYNFINNNIENILKIEAFLYFNKNNLRKQNNKKRALLVDKFYMLNNILNIDFSKINIFYIEKKERIKDIEYLFKIYLLNGKKVLYKYEDSKGILLINGKKIIDYIFYTNILNSLLKNIFNSNYIEKNNFYKKRHLKYWEYLFNN